MSRQRLKFLVLGVSVVGTMAALLLLAVQTSGSLMYYRTVSEFVADPQPGANLRVNGKVLPGSIGRASNGMQVQFVMTEGGQQLPVDYEGVIPDTFVDDAEVVVEGTLRSDGVFDATVLLAKCPSKYEAADGDSGAATYPAVD